MKLQLSNFATDCAPRLVEVPGNPLLTYTELRAGNGTAAHARNDGQALAEFRGGEGLWIWLEDDTRWTDIEVLSTDGARTQVSV